ncbi:MAG: hypothetical protein US89_C0013G0026 [Candidatus Peregrinibacteria bacterium GW2011_GWF2_38_29]|nr:MAG: hypothetical protein US89_C0013G0026 [Candidatus Peregrinibacteria bacterium GW2011_GWF2_38_29]HBB02406.1 hypothetical protein [Candidatus Peregrinibacteria bacterium]
MFKENRLIFLGDPEGGPGDTKTKLDSQKAPEALNPYEYDAEFQNIKAKRIVERMPKEIQKILDNSDTTSLKTAKLRKIQNYLSEYARTKQNLTYTGTEKEKREIQITLSQIAQLAARIDIQISNLKTPKPIESRESNTDLGLTPQEERMLARYKFWNYEKASAVVKARTWPHRFEDHEIMLRHLMNDNEKTTKATSNLRNIFFPSGTEKPYFIDIGPAIGGVSHGSKPAQTLQEMAEGFPNMECYALDLPEQYDILSGKTPKSKVGYEINPKNREEMLRRRNMHFISGDGLKSIQDQIADTNTNPYPGREKTPGIPKGAPIFIRAVNSIDICCDWNDKDGDTGVRTALLRMASDFKDSPVMLFFNEQILVKARGSTNWTIIGHVSPAGFDHRNATHNRQGQSPYTLDAKKVDKAVSENTPKTHPTLDREVSR